MAEQVVVSRFGADEPLSRHQKKIWRLDAKGLVGGVLMGVVMTVLSALILEKLDVSMTGGLFFPTSAGIHSTLLVISCIFFRLPGAWLTGETNGLIATITGTPVAPAFLANNFIYPIIATWISSRLSMRKWWHYLILLIPSVIIGYAPMVPVSMFTFHIPFKAAATGQALTDLSAIVIGTILTKLIADSIARSGVAE